MLVWVMRISTALQEVEQMLSDIRQKALSEFRLSAHITSGSIILNYETSHHTSYIDDAVERCGANPSTPEIDLDTLRTLRDRLRECST